MTPHQQPLSFGRMLDRSFQLYRRHFAKFALLALMMYGPLYLMYSWIFADTNPSFSFDNFGSSFTAPMDNEIGENISVGAILFFVFLLLPVTFLILTPVAFSTSVFLIGQVYDGDSPDLRTAFKQTFRRFWPLFGNSALFGLIMLGIYLVLVFAIVMLVVVLVFVFGIMGGLTSSAGFNGSAGFIFAAVVMYIAVILLVYAAISFFLIRWGYFIPAVTVQGEGIGLGPSWRLTKGSFWRLFFVYLVLSLVMTAFSFLNLLLIGFIPVTILQVLLSALFYILLSPLILSVYAVSYYDMTVRTQGKDLESMLTRMRDAEPDGGVRTVE